MTELLDAVMGQPGGDRLAQIANAIGADEATTQKGIQSALPARQPSTTTTLRCSTT